MIALSPGRPGCFCCWTLYDTAFLNKIFYLEVWVAGSIPTPTTWSPEVVFLIKLMSFSFRILVSDGGVSPPAESSMLLITPQDLEPFSSPFPTMSI